MQDFPLGYKLIEFRSDKSKILRRAHELKELGIQTRVVEKKGTWELWTKMIRRTPDEAMGESIAKQLGIRYDGFQEGLGMQFTDPETGSTTYGNSLEEVKSNLAKLRAAFIEAEEPGIPLSESDERIRTYIRIAKANKATCPVCKGMLEKMDRLLQHGEPLAMARVGQHLEQHVERAHSSFKPCVCQSYGPAPKIIVYDTVKLLKETPSLSNLFPKTSNVYEFTKGLNVELEHGCRRPETNVTCDDLEATARIALAHLLEKPDYYTLLAKLEEKTMEER